MVGPMSIGPTTAQINDYLIQPISSAFKLRIPIVDVSWEGAHKAESTVLLKSNPYLRSIERQKLTR